jgi:hypothetical protein
MSAVAPAFGLGQILWWCGATSSLIGLATLAGFWTRRTQRELMPGGDTRFARALWLRAVYTTVGFWGVPVVWDLADLLHPAYETRLIGVLAWFLGTPLLIAWLSGLIFPSVRALDRDFRSAWRRSGNRPKDWKRPRALELPGN